MAQGRQYHPAVECLELMSSVHRGAGFAGSSGMGIGSMDLTNDLIAMQKMAGPGTGAITQRVCWFAAHGARDDSARTASHVVPSFQERIREVTTFQNIEQGRTSGSGHSCTPDRHPPGCHLGLGRRQPADVLRQGRQQGRGVLAGMLQARNQNSATG